MRTKLINGTLEPDTTAWTLAPDDADNGMAKLGSRRNSIDDSIGKRATADDQDAFASLQAAP